MHKISNRSYFKLIMLSATFLVAGCTITTERDYIHKETASLRRVAIHALESINIDQSFIFVPNFRTFAWESPGSPSLIVIAEKEITVRFKEATVKGPSGTPESVVHLDSAVTLKRAKRQTTFRERQKTGGFFKGERLADAAHFIGRQSLPFKSEKFNTLTPLQLEIVASVDGGLFETFRFELKYRERTSPTFITR